MKDSVLIYSRPAWREWWWGVARETFKFSNLVGLSEFKGQNDICLMDYFYKYWNNKNIKLIDSSILPIEDVRSRCRLLANLPKEISLKMITCAWLAISEILDEVQPKYVFSITVDSYIVDLLARASRGRTIKFIGVSNCPLPGYALITERGEHNCIRSPSTEEIEKVYQTMLVEDFKPKYILGSKPYSAIDHMQRALYYRIKEILVYFKLKKDPCNYNLMCLPYAADKKKIFGYRAIKYFANDLSLSNLNMSTLPKIYIPLHFVPEATVSYWTKNLDFINYECTLFTILEILSKDFFIMIKEHPAAMGTRSDSFYKKLKEYKNTILIHPDFSSLDLINKCDAVLTWTGTVGLEAALRRKKVMVLGDPYYYLEEYFMKIKDLKELRNINLVNGSEMDLCDPKFILRYVLSNTVRGAFCQRGYLSKDNMFLLADHLKEVIV